MKEAKTMRELTITKRSKDDEIMEAIVLFFNDQNKD
jgi:hypothetical protein